MNVIREDGYYATVTMADGTAWGFTVAEHHGNIFTVKLAEEMLDWANTEYKKGCPAGYHKATYNPNMDFIKIKYDMTDYEKFVSYQGDETVISAKKKKIGTYNKNDKILRILEDGLPIYENNNGVVCRDSAALADSLM